LEQEFDSKHNDLLNAEKDRSKEEQTIKQLQQKIHDLEGLIEEANANKGDLGRKIRDTNEQYEQLLTDQSELQEDVANLEAQISKWQSDLTTIKRNIDDETALRTKAESSLREKQSTLTDLENNQHQLEDKNTNLDKSIKKNKLLQDDQSSKLEGLLKSINKGSKDQKKWNKIYQT